MRAGDRRMRAALWYAERYGFAVFPCHWIESGSRCSCGDAGCASPAKHPLTEHGCKDATKDPPQLRSWWKRWPEANAAIATGLVSGVLLLDIDPRHAGDTSLAELEAKHGKLPGTPRVLTGGGGAHIWFKYPDDTPIPNSAGRLGSGIDVRGDGGYVIAPPSVHASGNLYRWEISARIDELPLAEVPRWLLRLLLAPAVGDIRQKNLATGRVDFARVAAGLTEGERDWELFRLACALRRRGYDRALVEAVVLDAASRCRPPFPAHLALRKVSSAWRYTR